MQWHTLLVRCVPTRVPEERIGYYGPRTDSAGLTATGTVEYKGQRGAVRVDGKIAFTGTARYLSSVGAVYYTSVRSLSHSPPQLALWGYEQRATFPPPSLPHVHVFQLHMHHARECIRTAAAVALALWPHGVNVGGHAPVV